MKEKKFVERVFSGNVMCYTDVRNMNDRNVGKNSEKFEVFGVVEGMLRIIIR